MSEGEFKKRIQKHLHDFDHPWETSHCSSVMNTMVDEAKKEFEQLIFGTWDVDEEGWHPNRYAKDSWLTPSEAIKWFRKWFGEKK
jgi:hypothetical protein